MSEYARPRAVGFNHVALEVGDIEEALAFYGRLFRFELRGKSATMPFIDLGDQFIALQKGRRQAADDGRHVGLVWWMTRRRPARRSMQQVSPLLAGPSSIFAIPGVTASRSSATTTSNSPRPPTCCVGWA
jgi:lactoylglutathione lyase